MAGRRWKPGSDPLLPTEMTALSPLQSLKRCTVAGRPSFLTIRAPIQIEVDDLPLADGLQFKSFLASRPSVMVTGGKLVIDRPGEVEIYWTQTNR